MGRGVQLGGGEDLGVLGERLCMEGKGMSSVGKEGWETCEMGVTGVVK